MAKTVLRMNDKECNTSAAPKEKAKAIGIGINMWMMLSGRGTTTLAMDTLRMSTKRSRTRSKTKTFLTTATTSSRLFLVRNSHHQETSELGATLDCQQYASDHGLAGDWLYDEDMSSSPYGHNENCAER
jgi:hypothetical protein